MPFSVVLACSRVAEKGLVRCLTPLNSDLTSLHFTAVHFTAHYTLHGMLHIQHAQYIQYILLRVTLTLPYTYFQLFAVQSAHCSVKSGRLCTGCTSTQVHKYKYTSNKYTSCTECALFSEERPVHKLCIKTTFDRHSWRIPRCNPIQPKPLLLNSGQNLFCFARA